MTRFSDILDEACRRGPVRVVVAGADGADVLGAASRAQTMGIIGDSLLIGDGQTIRRTAEEHQLDLAGFTVADGSGGQDIARQAMAAVAAGLAKVAIKGQIETSSFLRAALSRELGLLTGRTISHVGIFQIPGFDRLLCITDGGVVLYPTLQQKIDIVCNGIEVTQRLGLARPKVALLAAADRVLLEVPVTMEIAQIVAMKDRWNEAGAEVDGPFTLDSAISRDLAVSRGLSGSVAGCADVLVCPDVESGNIMAKAVTYLAGGVMAGVVVGARAPLVVGSRSDPEDTRLACMAAGVLVATDV